MEIKLTNRLKKIIRRSEEETNQLNKNILKPEHLLLAFMQEKSGPFGEIYLNLQTALNKIRTQINNNEDIKHTYFNQYTDYPLTEDVENIVSLGLTYMKNYNQVYLNEGHILKALIKSNTINHLISDEEIQMFIKLGTTARDLIVHLDSYECPNLTMDITKVNKEQSNDLLTFVNKNFSKEWAETVQYGLKQDNPNIFIIKDSIENIIGFACFDTYLNKKGYFGPMGVSNQHRTEGVGYHLLHYCLNEMKKAGYEYGILGGAGPIEFYENTCHAKVIPIYK